MAIACVKQQPLALLDNDPLIADWLARFMTAPKYPDLVIRLASNYKPSGRLNANTAMVSRMLEGRGEP